MKKFLFFLSALFLTAPAFAQTDDDEGFSSEGGASKKSAFFVGPKIGVTMNTMTQPSEGDLYDKMGIGFSGGLAAKIRFGNASEGSEAGTGYFGVGLELKYRQSSVGTKAIDESGKADAKFTMSYFEAPISAQVYPFVKSSSMNTLYVELGAAIAGTLSRSPKILTLLNPNEQCSSVTYNIDNGDKKLKGMDVRPFIGVGYTIPGTGLDINARYCIGTSKLAENFASKINNFEISLAWMFKAAKF